MLYFKSELHPQAVSLTIRVWPATSVDRPCKNNTQTVPNTQTALSKWWNEGMHVEKQLIYCI